MPRIGRGLNFLALLVTLVGASGMVICKAYAQQEIEGQTRRLVVEFDPDRLMGELFDGAASEGGATFSPGFLLKRRYSLPDPSSEAEVLFGIFDSSETAERNLTLTTAPLSLNFFSEGEMTGFLTGHAFHLRFKNLVIMVHLLGEKPELERLDVLSQKAQRLLTQEGIVRLGAEPRLPRVRVRQLYEHPEVPLDQGAGFVVEVPIEETELLTNGIVQGREADRHRLPTGRSVVGVSTGFLQGGPILRAARPTGEIQEITVGEAQRRGAAVTAAPVSISKRTMTDSAIRSTLEALRTEDLDLTRKSDLLLRLVEQRDRSLVPYFEEVLASDQDSVLKQYAFWGISKALEEAGLERYRSYAINESQPEVVRRDAILKIGSYGGRDDVPLLQALTSSELSSLASAARRAIRSIEKRASAGSER